MSTNSNALPSASFSSRMIDLCTPPGSPSFVKQEEKSSGMQQPSLSTGKRPLADDVNVIEMNPNKRITQVVFDDDDDDVVCTKIVGERALFDYPHNRCDCGKFSWSTSAPVKFCGMCYCYVCDGLSSDCPEWKHHCHAHPNSQYWKDERAKWKSTAQQCIFKYSDQELFQKLVHVHPHTMDVSTKVPLMLTQQQALAWMVDKECGNGLAVGDILQNNDLTNDHAVRKITGGILADEMGMGKTATIIALCMRQPLSPGRITLIAAPFGVITQWERAVAAFSDLKVAKLYCCPQDTVAARIHEYQIVIVNAGSNLDSRIWNATERLVVDEAHILLGTGCPFSGAAVSCIRNTWSSHEPPFLKYRWAVSGTPFERIIDDKMANLVRFLTGCSRGHRISTGITIDTLKKLVLRRIKSQQIKHQDGTIGDAVKVPVLQVSTLEVSLSASETRLYEIATHLDVNYSLEPTTRGSFNKNFCFRLLIASGKLDAFQKTATEKISDRFIPSYNSFKWIEHMKILLCEIDTLVNTASKSVSKFEKIIKHYTEHKKVNNAYKALLVTEFVDDAAQYINSRLKTIVVTLKRGSVKVKAQQAIDAFHQGNGDLLILSPQIAEQGVNLEQAQTIYFTDPDFDTSRFKQMCARISRAGCKHESLYAISVVMRNTVQEAIMKYHQQQNDSMQVFDQLNANIHVPTFKHTTWKCFPTGSTPASHIIQQSVVQIRLITTDFVEDLDPRLLISVTMPCPFQYWCLSTKDRAEYPLRIHLKDSYDFVSVLPGAKIKICQLEHDDALEFDASECVFVDFYGQPTSGDNCPNSMCLSKIIAVDKQSVADVKALQKNWNIFKVTHGNVPQIVCFSAYEMKIETCWCGSCSLNKNASKFRCVGFVPNDYERSRINEKVTLVPPFRQDVPMKLANKTQLQTLRAMTDVQKEIRLDNEYNCGLTVLPFTTYTFRTVNAFFKDPALTTKYSELLVRIPSGTNMLERIGFELYDKTHECIITNKEYHSGDYYFRHRLPSVHVNNQHTDSMHNIVMTDDSYKLWKNVRLKQVPNVTLKLVVV